jgi:hypothetical protein
VTGNARSHLRAAQSAHAMIVEAMQAVSRSVRELF